MNVIMALNLKNMAATQLADLAVNSLGVFEDELIVASADGLHTFKEASEFGEEEEMEAVSAFFELPRALLGHNRPKAPRSLLISGRVLGALGVDITDETGTTVSYTTAVLDTYEGTKVALQTNQAGRYFQVKIKSLDGAYFSIDRIDLVFIPRPERRR